MYGLAGRYLVLCFHPMRARIAGRKASCGPKILENPEKKGRFWAQLINGKFGEKCPRNLTFLLRGGGQCNTPRFGILPIFAHFLHFGGFTCFLAADPFVTEKGFVKT